MKLGASGMKPNQPQKSDHQIGCLNKEELRRGWSNGDDEYVVSGGITTGQLQFAE